MPFSAPISVVIPAHNAERFIAEALQSVQKQTVKVSEVIVVADDCSDRTPEIAADLGATVLSHNKRSMAVGLNMGVRASREPWIGFLDADDFWHKEKIAAQWKAVHNFPNAAMVSCDVSMLLRGKIVRRSSRHLADRWRNVENVKTTGCRFLERIDGNFLSRFFIATPSVIVRRAVFSEVGFFDESLPFGQTLEFFARVLARYPLAFVEKPLVYHRRHDNNHTGDLGGYWPAYISIVDRMLKYPERYPPGAGDAFREQVKKDFHQFERGLARRKVHRSRE